MTSPATPVPAPTVTGAAARAVDLTKVYGSGDTRVVALDAVSCAFERGRFTADHGPVGLGQVDADALHGRPRHRDLRLGLHRRRRPLQPRRQAADPAAPRQPRLHLPGLQPGADPERDREHHAADGHRRTQAGPGVARRRHRHRRAARPAAPPAQRAVRRSAAARGRARARWPAGRRSSSPTSRPATSTHGPAPRSSRSCSKSVREMGQTIVMVTHDPAAAAYADRVVFLADGRIVDEITVPDGRVGPRPDEELRRAGPAGELTSCCASPSRACSPASCACCSPLSRWSSASPSWPGR